MLTIISPLRARSSAALPVLAYLGLGACDPTVERSDPDARLHPRHADWPELDSLALGGGMTCATLVSGAAKCWGHGEGGRLGPWGAPSMLSVEPSEAPLLDLGPGVAAIATTGSRTLLRLADGAVIGFGPGTDPTSTTAVVPLARPAHQVVAGEGFGCALLDDARVQCWGRGDQGQLGTEAVADAHDPVDVPIAGAVVELAAGAAHVCARLDSGDIRCWGRNDEEQLGHPLPPADDGQLLEPGEVPLDGPAIRVLAGAYHSCALLESGVLQCWGDDDDGQVGGEQLGDDQASTEPSRPDFGIPVVDAAAGRHHTCAVLHDGTLWCWGSDQYRQLGRAIEGSSDGSLPELAAVDLEGARVRRVFAGALADHTCAQLEDGPTRCWGRNDFGQLGLGLSSPEDPVEGPPGDLPDVIIVEDPDE